MSEQHVAVVGLTGCGKTTFLISLISHLLNPGSKGFNLGTTDKKVRAKWRDESDAGTRWYKQMRATLASGDWPEKTLKTHAYRFQWRTPKGWFWSSIKNVTFHDIPGERLIDIAMLTCPSFAVWSNTIRDSIANDPTLRDRGAAFLELYDNPLPEKTSDGDIATRIHELKREYLRYLTKVVESNSPFVSPSTIFIDEFGEDLIDRWQKSVPNPSEPFSVDAVVEFLLKSGECGLQGKPFCPLPEQLISTAAGKVVAENYLLYRKTLVEKQLTPLRLCSDLLVLIDVAQLLQRGPAWKNLCQDSIDQLAKLIDNRTVFWKISQGIARVCTLGRKVPGRKRIHFVATQADRVLRADRNNLRCFLDELATPFLTSDATLDWFDHVVSAVDSTEAVDGVIRYPNPDATNGQPSHISFSPPKLPEKGFPDSWQVEDFEFPRPVPPKFPDNRTNSPPQFGLDKVAKIILNLS